MKKIVLFIIGLMTLMACQQKQEQKKAGFIVQVSLGGWHRPDYTAEQIIGRIDTVSQLIPVQKVIIGWSQDKDIYRQVAEYLHNKNIRMLLWLPVFAETEEVCDNTPAVDLWGQVPSNYDLAAGEDFRFNCPTDPKNIVNIVHLYDSLFSDCGFDGVFLDRIRTQSFVSGVNGVLGCGCPLCVERFAAEGVDIQEVKSEFETKGDARNTRPKAMPSSPLVSTPRHSLSTSRTLSPQPSSRPRDTSSAPPWQPSPTVSAVAVWRWAWISMHPSWRPSLVKTIQS